MKKIFCLIYPLSRLNYFYIEKRRKRCFRIDFWRQPYKTQNTKKYRKMFCFIPELSLNDHWYVLYYINIMPVCFHYASQLPTRYNIFHCYAVSWLTTTIGKRVNTKFERIIIYFEDLFDSRILAWSQTTTLFNTRPIVGSGTI